MDSWDTHYDGLARLAAGEDIIVLSVGQETHELTPAPIVEAAVASLKAGQHHYAPVEGLPELRRAIARRHRELTGQDVDDSNCAVFAGAQNALFAAAQCVLEPGDEVILIEPYYTTYPGTVSASGATIVSVAVKPENRFQIDPNDIIAAITPRTRAILVNSPNNPTGAVYTREQFEPLVAACVENEIWLINDEVYQEILLPEDRASPAGLPGADQVCITVSSLSKSHRMTGWRLGWIVGPKSLMPHLYNLSMCMAYGLPEFIMEAAVEAFEYGDMAAQQVRVNMDRRRKIIERMLGRVHGLNIFSSVGGMYVVLDVRALPVTSRQFARQMLDDYDVSVLPCDGFGETGRGLIRVSLCAEDDQMEVACKRIADYVATLAIPAESSVA